MFRILGLIVTLAMMGVSGSVQASEPKLIGSHGQWSAYSFMENGNKVCYMASQPQKAEGDYTSRGDIFALITHRPAENTRNVFSYITGYPYDPESKVTVKIDSQTYTLFTQDDTAWAADADADTRLTSAIRKGSRMVVQGTSKRGTLTTDTFSLSGSAKAYDMITEACGY